jgi:uncharacterized protein (TIGR03437 family)
MLPAAPGVYSLDGAGIGQGLITLAGTSLLATSRDYRALGQPAEPGDSIAIRATGIAGFEGVLTVKIGGLDAHVQSVEAIPGVAGVYEITTAVPFGVQEGDAIPVVVSIRPDQPLATRKPLEAPNPRSLAPMSNQTTIAVEQP